jgi:cobaltochelatase CobN
VFQILTTADTEPQGLAAAIRRLPADSPSVRARNANNLLVPVALDRFLDQDLPPRRARIVRVLGGRPYFAAGFERLSRECKTLESR